MKLTSLLTLVIFLLLFQCTQAQNSSPYWSLSGNSNATTASKLGTTTQTPLRLITNNTTRMYISPKVGYVGIGTTNPLGKLFVLNNGSSPATVWTGSGTPLFGGFGEITSGNADFYVAMASNTASARPVFIGKRSRGTLAAPTGVSSGDYLATIRSSGYDGSTFQNTASIDFVVDGTAGASKVPTRLSFATGSTTGNKIERLRIASNGDISFNTDQLFVQKSTGSIGIGTTAPNANYKLDVRSITNGIYGVSIPEDGSVSSIGRGIGVVGSGSTGVQGTGYVGVRGYANGDGSAGYGVYGENYGQGAGVFGKDPDGVGVLGIGNTGLRAQATEVGASVYSSGFFGTVSIAQIYGVEGRATAPDGYGGHFYSTTGGGILASSGSEPGSLAGMFEGNVYTTGTYQSSDVNLKQNIKEFDGALDIINKLKPRNYEFKTDEKLAALHLPKGNHYGLIAQEVEKVIPNLVKDMRHNLNVPMLLDTATSVQKSKLESPVKEFITTKAVNYTELIPIIIKGMQEQEAENKALKAEVAELRQMVLELKNGSTGTVTTISSYLEQNIPNPVNGTTTIRYHITEAVTSARLDVTNAKGQLVKTLNLSNRGTGQVTLNTTMLAAGTYNYTLYVDGKPVETKRLMIAK